MSYADSKTEKPSQMRCAWGDLAGVVRDRADAMARLRSYHVAFKAQAWRVDTASLEMNKPIEEQLSEALARVQSLESDAQASANLLSESSAQAEALRTQLTATLGERDRATADLLIAQQSVETLTARNRELEARETDLETRAAARAAQIVASTGTRTPAKISPAGETDLAAVESATPGELIVRYGEFIKNRQPKAAAEFYEKHLKHLFNH